MEGSERMNWMQILLILYCYQRIAACQLQSSDGVIKMWPMEEEV